MTISTDRSPEIGVWAFAHLGAIFRQGVWLER